MDDAHGCLGHSHDHDHDDVRGVSLRKYYDLDGVQCLNEQVVGSGRHMVAKYYEDRFTNVPNVTSPPDDPELLLTIPFTEAVTIHSITIRGSNPRRIKLFCNRNDLDFDIVRDMPGMMELELLPHDHMIGIGDNGTVDYPLRPVGRFRNIDSLTIFFLDNYNMGDDDNNDGDDDTTIDGTSTEICYVGLKGVGSGIQRRPVEAVYETQGMPKDHQVKDDAFGSHNMLY